MQAMVIPRKQSRMGRLSDGMFCVTNIFSMDSSVKSEALINWNLTAERVVSTYRDDKGAQEHL